MSWFGRRRRLFLRGLWRELRVLGVLLPWGSKMVKVGLVVFCNALMSLVYTVLSSH